ncbi:MULTISPECIES: restriction endonuclease subunit S [Aeromonas]|uniref:restriction endonuclease subunit S n=1 Tax=Aeromonas TaxID=642 RepID=UPI00191FB76A|nr:restriction endonuclease subunit S [Aeromonas dhakensis]MBL0657124.1 restriction endonuclease subunit S [Aeromonas dhakensis]
MAELIMQNQVGEMAAKQTIPAGYKQTEVGIIPEDWNYGHLECVCPIGKKYGIVDGPFGSNLKTEHYRDSGIPIISSGFVTNGFFHADEYLYVDEDKFRQEKRSAVAPGDIVMAKIGARCGASAILPLEHEVGIISGNALKVTVNTNEHSTYFVWQHLWNKYLTGKLDDITATGAQPAISMPYLKKMLIPLPIKKEQIAIATALSDTDALIVGLEQLIAKKQAIKTATMQQLLTGRTRLPQFALRSDGTAKGYKTSELGQIPEDWEVVPFGNTLTIRHGKNQKAVESSNGTIPIFATGGQIGWADQYLWNKPSVLIGRKGTIDKPRYLDTPFWTVDTLFYSEIKDCADPKFIFYKFCMIDWMQYNEASGVPSLNASTIERVLASLPLKEEQTAIATILSDMDNELTALEQKLAKARDVKQGMMQQLLTGRIRLPLPQEA